MGNNLHKLGSFAFSNAWYIIAGWIAVIVILGFSAAHFMKPTSSAISIPGTEGQKAIDRMSELFPGAGKGSGRIVFAAPQGKTLDEYKTQIEKTTNDVDNAKGVAQAISPFENTTALSADKTIAYTQIQLKNENGSVSKETRDAVSKSANAARANGLEVELGGDIIDKAPGEILGVGEIAGVVIALLVLVATLGSLIAAGMPVATALIAVAASMGGLFSLSQVMTISVTTPVLAVMLGLAVGIDYSLFIISKYRTYALQGYAFKDAAAKALGTAGNAVVFAAATVVIALASLAIVQIPFMTTMGLTAAATIAVAALVAITLVPALLGLAGQYVFGRRARQKVLKAQAKGPHDSHRINHSSFWYKWGAVITRRPVIALVLGVAVIVAIALPVKQLTLGLPTDEYAAKTSTERKAYDLLARGFGAGFNGPLLVVAEKLPTVSDADRNSVREPAMKQYNEQVALATAAQESIFQEKAAQVATPEQAAVLQQEIATAQAEGQKKQQEALAQIDQSVEQYARLVQLKKVADQVAELDNVEKALPAAATDDGTAGIIQVIPKSAPSHAKTGELITYLRDENNQKKLGAVMAVTGSTALQNDVNAKLASALPLYLSVVVGLSLVLLVVAFRSILVPIKATLGFLLSVLAMFGALVAVFQWGWFGIAEAPGPIISFIPIIAIGILFGLAMDYEFFLVSSMHEAYQYDKDARKAVVNGFGLGSKVVTAAGLIMIAVFAGFITNHDVTVQAIGFGLAVGILVDAFIVRMTIVPAVMTLLGKSAWWLPAWLDRIIPHVSIEGEEAKK
jgi:putative drug exporter of the RND superfamily